MTLSSPPRIAVTGPDGFVAWHVRCAARARWGGDLIRVGRAEFSSPDLMDAALQTADAVIHLAGINRAWNQSEIAQGNPWLAEQLVRSLERINRPITIIYGNSIHSMGDSPFGIAKRAAADVLAEWGNRSGAPIVDVLLPNLFGEHGVPNYNSIVATFSHLIARGEPPVITDDKELPLLHAQRAAKLLLDQALSPTCGTVQVESTPMLVSDVADRLIAMASEYRTGALPNLSDSFTRDLFNTYRAATVPEQWPLFPTINADQRGGLVEVVRASGGQTQIFFSSTNPGFTRGQHYHLGKVERFLVLSGRANICLRRLLTDEVITFPVSGERPAIVDMPTMWVHSITNTGSEELVTLFYADELYDPEQPDTYPEEV